MPINLTEANKPYVTEIYVRLGGFYTFPISRSAFCADKIASLSEPPKV